MGYNKVEKWINKLNPSTVESNHTISSVSSDSSLQQLVNPDDSASNVSEVVSESALPNVNEVVSEASRVYDMSNIKDVLDLMNDPTVVFSSYPVDNGDSLLTFYTADSANEILISTLDHLLTNVN